MIVESHFCSPFNPAAMFCKLFSVYKDVKPMKKSIYFIKESVAELLKRSFL